MSSGFAWLGIAAVRVPPAAVETGPIPDKIVEELEALKWRLADMHSPEEIPADQAEALHTQISAIRLHLKRLTLDRQRIADEVEVSLGLRLPPEEHGKGQQQFDE